MKAVRFILYANKVLTQKVIKENNLSKSLLAILQIPALVSLKKLPSVSFAGVDTLDDVKNHTYNELFVSGGFIVSDEFVLSPDLITQGKLYLFFLVGTVLTSWKYQLIKSLCCLLCSDRLLGLLKFLEEQSTPEHPWQWKVHCKSQKKLKEMGRSESLQLQLGKIVVIKNDLMHFE